MGRKEEIEKNLGLGDNILMLYTIYSQLNAQDRKIVEARVKRLVAQHGGDPNSVNLTMPPSKDRQTIISRSGTLQSEVKTERRNIPPRSAAKVVLKNALSLVRSIAHIVSENGDDTTWLPELCRPYPFAETQTPGFFAGPYPKGTVFPTPRTHDPIQTC